jgi:hypothetical protein
MRNRGSTVAANVIQVWKKVSPELEAEIVRFWTDNKAIGEENDAAKRAKQVVCIARDEAGALVGVSTAHPRIVPRLRQPMYYYRNFIAEVARGQQLAPKFLEQSKQALQAYNLGLSKPLCLGMIIELENKGLAAHRNEAQWKEGFTFIGYSPKGLTLRVWYFEGVKLFAPARLKKQAGGPRPRQAAAGA